MEDEFRRRRRSRSRKKDQKRSKIEEKDENVNATIATLSEKHGNSYTPMQYRVWAEMHLKHSRTGRHS